MTLRERERVRYRKKKQFWIIESVLELVLTINHSVFEWQDTISTPVAEKQEERVVDCRHNRWHRHCYVTLLIPQSWNSKPHCCVSSAVSKGTKRLEPPWKCIFFSPEHPRKGSDLFPFKLRHQFELQTLGTTFFNFSVDSGFKSRHRAHAFDDEEKPVKWRVHQTRATGTWQ